MFSRPAVSGNRFAQFFSFKLIFKIAQEMKVELQNIVRIQLDGVKMHSNCIQNIVGMQSECIQNVVRIQSECSCIVVRMRCRRGYPKPTRSSYQSLFQNVSHGDFISKGLMNLSSKYLLSPRAYKRHFSHNQFTKDIVQIQYGLSGHCPLVKGLHI